MSTVTFSPFTNILENGTNTTLIAGSPGSGKTYFLLTIIANALMMNQKNTSNPREKFKRTQG